MRYLEAPTQFSGRERTLFLAGGISGCRDWQRELVARLAETDLVILNPRRANFPMGDPAAGREQIEWEFRHQRRATMAAFWFPPETLCPITLYELGAWSMLLDKPLFVGTDPAYARRFDVEVQLALARPEVRVVGSLAELAGQVAAAAARPFPSRSPFVHPIPPGTKGDGVAEDSSSNYAD